jgi:hypothetical protein
VDRGDQAVEAHQLLAQHRVHALIVINGVPVGPRGRGHTYCH